VKNDTTTKLLDERGRKHTLGMSFPARADEVRHAGWVRWCPYAWTVGLLAGCELLLNNGVLPSAIFCEKARN
jgi:hypothetical protein